MTSRDRERFELLWVTVYAALVSAMVASAVSHWGGLALALEAVTCQ